MAKKLLKNYFFTPGVGINENLRPNAYALISANRTFIIKEIVAFIQNKVDAGAPGYSGYTYSTVKCERDSGYVIDALLHDLRYGGNEKIYDTASAYWVGNIPQIDGSRIPEYEAYQFAQILINNHIITNTLDTSPEQEIEQQIIDLSKTVESNTDEYVTSLLGTVVDVIQNGLDSLPVQDVKLGRIEVLGKIGLEDLLLISNVDDNTVIYNFADPAKGGTTEFLEGNTRNYPNALTVNNGVTFIRFKTDTSAMTSSSAIQLFIESSEMRVRPYDFGTDAIERMRVAQPQAMIDADFEYGLQPTKWQAIGMLRGYPASYEVSASDIPVSQVTTDASAGSGGIGASIITVTTQGPHGLEDGDLISIRALSSSVLGFGRAEGTFLIFSIVSDTEFKYYAKSKVGTSAGQTLSGETTQLRKSNFYTGASIGQPEISVYSNGSSGSFITALRSPTNSNILTFIGAVPPIGAPLSGTGIASGTQVTGSFGPANSDGVVDYRYVKTTYTSGASSIDLTNVSELSANMAVSDGGTPEEILEITSIAGNTLNLSGLTQSGAVGDENIYSGSAIGVNSSGAGLRIDITRTSENYSYSINEAGGGYEQGDTVRIPGTSLGGTSPANDVYFNVEAISSGAVIDIIIITGDATGLGDASYTNIASLASSSRGTGATFNVERASGTYTLQSVTGTTINFFPGNKFRIPGTSFEGTTPANDVFITVNAIDSSGTITDAVITAGVARRGDQIPVYATVAISENISAAIDAGATISYSSIAELEVTWPSGHGLVPGTSINVQIISTGTGHELASGPYFVDKVPNLNTIRYIARTAGTIDDSTDALEGSIYARPDSFFSHRPFDGGVQLGTGGPQHGGQAIRQSKKYIRYQSGKGAMYNTGVLFAPSFDIRSVTSTGILSGSVITVTLDEVDHGVQPGAVIELSGIETTGYNGSYSVTEIVDERSFKIVAQTALGSATGTVGPQCQMALKNWHGAVIRSGPYDDQNGIFFQYDGKEVAVGRRSSTFQLAGTIALNSDENEVTGTNTRFLDQLQEGDRIVIKGMTHVVAVISSNTSMTITPDFRGVTNLTAAKICKVEDLIIPQSEWNLDKCDGTGPSGYKVDVTKMQMIGIQFSWYGAGFIDWMFRGPDGNYIFCHRLKGNNLNTEAYMRTGNAPVRYEVLNESARSRLNGSINDSQTTITLDDTHYFPAEGGTVYVDNELISFAGKNDSTNQLTGCTRAATLINFAAGSARSYTAGTATSHNDNQGVVLVSCTTSPIISHWGSAYLIDGNFDEDRGYIFNYAATGLSISATKNTVFLIRLAPSVSNAVTGDLGERELLNRAQLLLQSISITSNPQAVADSGGLVIEGVLNPSNYPLNPNDIIWTGLQGSAGGGQPSFAQIANGGSVNWSGGSTASTSTATVQGVLSGSFTAKDIGFGTFSTNRNRFFLTNAEADVSGIEVGDRVTSRFPAGTVVNEIIRDPRIQGITYTGYTRYNTSSDASVTLSGDQTIALEKQNTAASYTRTNYLFFTLATWNASGATIGTPLASSVTTFPANTSVSGVDKTINLDGTTIVKVTFNQSSNTTINSAATITFSFGSPAYAQPGEQVFSFISNPGETNTLDLGSLKELTTTSIGGRGTFPNGPDVLAINVYKVGGTATTANVILRWGEAQA